MEASAAWGGEGVEEVGGFIRVREVGEEEFVRRWRVFLLQGRGGGDRLGVEEEVVNSKGGI